MNHEARPSSFGKGNAVAESSFEIEDHADVRVIRPLMALRRDCLEDDQIDPSNFVDAKTPFVIIDLSSVPMIDGKGMEWMLNLDRRTEALDGCVRIAAANELCRDILRITSIGERLGTYPTVEAALADLAQ